jgi:hypothetical protein
VTPTFSEWRAAARELALLLYGHDLAGLDEHLLAGYAAGDTPAEPRRTLLRWVATSGVHMKPGWRVIGPRTSLAVNCFCSKTSPLCNACVEAALTRPLLRAVERSGRRWGTSVFRRRPDGTWPHWDDPSSGRLRAEAFRLVAGAATDAGVLDRLARACAYHAGMAYREAQRRG